MSTLPMTTWGLDPLLHVPFQLMIFQVHALVPVPACEGVYSHHGHPVGMVEIMGVIQSVNRALKYISYTVDDGTGAIQCVMWIPDNHLMVQDTNSIQGLKMFSLGDVVKVKGYLEAFRDSMQIDVQPGCIVGYEDPNAETLFRLQVLNLERNVYSKPVELPYFVRQQFGVVTPLGEEETTKGDSTKEDSTNGEATKGNATKVEATKKEATKKEATTKEATTKEATKEEVTKAEVAKEEVAIVKITERTLLDRLRAWIIGRKEFCILELMYDETNKRMGEEVAQKRREPGERPLIRCYQKLVTEGWLECINEDRLIYRAVSPQRKKEQDLHSGGVIFIDDD